jgi:D-3-phosphoglycerate dehydrogenase
VSNCPGKNAIAVAELVFALILAIDRALLTTSRTCAPASGTRKILKGPRLTAGHSAFSVLPHRQESPARDAFGMPLVVWSGDSRRFSLTFF